MEYKTEWSGELENAHNTIHAREDCDVDALIEEMRLLRESYPGWIVLPASHMKEFSDTKEDIPFWSNLYAKCADNTKKQIGFLYEVNWRIETALGSSDMEWYLQALRQMPFEPNEDLDTTTYQRLLGLKLSLLNVYRLKGEDEDYLDLLENIETHISQLTYEQKCQLTYIKCLHAISTLGYTDIQQIVDGWHLRSLDYQGHLWKAGVLIEIGQQREAQILLRDLLKSVKRNILTSKYSALLSSVRSAIELFLWRMDFTYPIYKPTPDFDFTEIIRTSRDLIVKGENQPSRHQKTHGFNLLDSSQQWNFPGGGFKGDFYGAIRYFRLYEKLGFPFGIPKGFSSDVDTKTFMVERLLRYHPKYALQWIVRSCAVKTVEALNRKTLLSLGRDKACLYFDKLIASCEAGLEQNAGQALQTRVLTSLLPVLVRLSVLLTQDRIECLFSALCTVYRQYSNSYKGEHVLTLYNNLSGESLKRCQRKALEEPILQLYHGEYDFKMPRLWRDEIEYSEKAGEIAMKSLFSSELEEQEAAYERLRILKKTKNSLALGNYVKEWREIPPLSDDKLRSLFLFPEEEDRMISIATTELNSFLRRDFRNGDPSKEISNSLFRLRFCYPRFTEEQHLSFLKKVTELLTENQDTFKKDDPDDFFAAFRPDVGKIFYELAYYTQANSLPSKDKNEWQSFKEVIERYCKDEHPVLTIMIHLSYLGIWDKSIVESDIKKDLFSSSGTVIEDAGKALAFMTKKEGSSIDQSIVEQIISRVSYIFDDETPIYLNIIEDVLLNKGISKETRGMLEEWVNNLPNKIDHYSISEEIKDDIRYYANRISGIMSVVWRDWSGLSDWQAYMKEDYIKNDVRNGFEYGIHLAKSQS